MKTLLASTTLIAFLATSASAQLLFDDFDNNNLATGGPGSTNGGFTASVNGSGAGSSSEPAGTSALLSSDTVFRSQGIASSNAVDLGSLSSFTVTFDVSGTTGVLGGNGIFLGLKDTNVSTFYRSEPNFGIAIGSNKSNYGSGSDEVVLVANDTDPDGGIVQATIFEDIDFASLADGFTASFTVNSDNTFSYSVSGITGTGSGTGSGSVTGTVFASQFDNADYVIAAIQRDGTPSAPSGAATMSVDSIAVIPEPSSLALLSGFAALAMLVRRRR
jgi:hypothetical protein